MGLFDYVAAAAPGIIQSNKSLGDMMQHDENIKLQQLQETRLNQAQQIENQKNQFMLDKMMKEQKLAETPINGTSYLLAQGVHPEDAKKYTDAAAAEGLGEYNQLGDFITKRMHKDAIVEKVLKAPALGYAVNQGRAQRLQSVLDEESKISSDILEADPVSYNENQKYKDSILRQVKIKEELAKVTARAEAAAKAMKPDNNITEAEILMLPQNDPRRASYIEGKQGMMEGKSQTIEQLTARSLQGDTRAQAILDDMSKRKIREANGGIDPPQPLSMSPMSNPKEAGLQGLDEGAKAMVQKISRYEYPLPAGFSMAKPYWQNIMARAQLLNPDFDGTQYQIRVSARRDFTSGKSANNILALNTLVGHIDSLMKSAGELNNSDWQAANKAENLMSKYAPVTPGLIKRQGEITSVKTRFNAVKGEMANTFKQSGATDQEIKSWDSTIDDPTTATPAQWKAFKDSSMELLGSRLEAQTNKYEQAMGQPKDFKLLSDKSRAVLKKLGMDVDKIDPVTIPPSNESTKASIPSVRNNNPLNIKMGGATKQFVDAGMAQIGSTAKDGGVFLKFNSPDEGLNAAQKLLFDSPVYRGLTVDSAMKKWSNSGYGGNIVPSIANKQVASLNSQEREMLVQSMLRAEGSNGSSSAPKAGTSWAELKKKKGW